MRCVCVRLLVQPVCQQHELRAFCAARDIAWMAHTPFGGKGAPLLRDGRLQPACRRLGASPAQIVLGWCRHHGAIAIPKTQSEVRMRENAAPCALDAGAAASLDAMDPPPPGLDIAPPSEGSTTSDARADPSAAVTPTASAEVLASARALLDVVTAVVQVEGQQSDGDRSCPAAGGRGCAWFGDVSPTELVDFTRSELREVEQELATLRKLKVEAVGHLLATVSWADGPRGPHWKDEQDEQDACCRRLQGELGDVLFDALLLARKCEVATARQVSLAGAFSMVAEKVRRRCPHVFAGEPAPTRADAEAIWQREKAKERQRTAIAVELLESAVPETDHPNQGSTKVPVQETDCSSDEEDDRLLMQSPSLPRQHAPPQHDTICDLSSAADALGTDVQTLLAMSESALDEILEDKLGVKRAARKQICDERTARGRARQRQQEQATAVQSPVPQPQVETLGTGDSSASELKEQGTTAFKNKDYIQAAAFYGAAAKCAPDDATHSANQCLSLLRAKQPAAAVEAAREAVRRKPGWAKAHYRLGSALVALGEGLHSESSESAAASTALDVLREAQAALSRACELEPSNAPMTNALRDVRQTIDTALAQGQSSVKTESVVAEADTAAANTGNAATPSVPTSPADIGRNDGSSKRVAVPKPQPLDSSRGAQPSGSDVDEEKAEAPELPKAKINPLGSLIDDLPVAKGPNNPADAVNAALDKARAFDQPAPIPNPTPAATPVEGTPTEAGDAEGVYKRWPVSRVVVDGKGKALMAARPILAGAVIYQARPWISVVADSFMRSVCSHCFKSTTDEMQGGADAGPAPDLPFSCPSCAACGYCSVKCKEAAANVHAKECVSVAQVVKMTAGKTESRGPRMIIRALAQRAVDLEGGDAEAERKRQLNLPTFVDVCELVDHMNDLPPHKQKEFLSIAAGVGSLPIGKGVGRAELVRLVATLRCNSQAVVDVANQRKGDVLIAPADFNHSCTPNCTVAFYGNTVQVRALTEIEPDEELTIQYTDLYLPRAERRNKLESSHCFSCACPRCTEQGNQTADQRVEGFRCGVKKCDGLVPPPLPTATATATVGPGAAGAEKQTASWICVKCGQSHAHRAETLQRSAAAAKVLYTTAVETQRRGDFEAARSLLEKLISQHSSALFWQHAILYNAHHALFSACNALEDTEDAATAAAKALACLRAVYPPYHPVRLAVFEQRIVRFLARIADMRAHGARVTSGSGITDECPRSYRVASFPSLKRRRRRAAGRGNRMLPAVPRHSADLCG